MGRRPRRSAPPTKPRRPGRADHAAVAPRPDPADCRRPGRGVAHDPRHRPARRRLRLRRRRRRAAHRGGEEPVLRLRRRPAGPGPGRRGRRHLERPERRGVLEPTVQSGRLERRPGRLRGPPRDVLDEGAHPPAGERRRSECLEGRVPDGRPRHGHLVPKARRGLSRERAPRPDLRHGRPCPPRRQLVRAAVGQASEERDCRRGRLRQARRRPGSRLSRHRAADPGHRRRDDLVPRAGLPDDDRPSKARVYAGVETDSGLVSPWSDAAAKDTRKGPAPDQATQLADAIRIAACQPAVGAFFNFHLADEAGLGGWQSGLAWADWTPKPSLGTFSASSRTSTAARSAATRSRRRACLLGPCRCRRRCP